MFTGCGLPGPRCSAPMAMMSLLFLFIVLISPLGSMASVCCCNGTIFPTMQCYDDPAHCAFVENCGASQPTRTSMQGDGTPCCAGSFVGKGSGSFYPPDLFPKINWDFDMYNSGLFFAARREGEGVNMGSMFLNGKGWWLWTSETDCRKVGNIGQKTPNLCVGPDRFFSNFRGNVALPGGLILERWADKANSTHSIFFEPKTCTPTSEVGLGFGGYPASGITYYDVQKIEPDPKVFEVPTFCPQ